MRTSVYFFKDVVVIRESSLSWSGVMVVEVTGRASCLGGAAAVSRNCNNDIHSDLELYFEITFLPNNWKQKKPINFVVLVFAVLSTLR